MRQMQTVLFIYDGTYFVAFTLNVASTTYYGLTRLTSSTSSTSTGLAATASAVKAAYDRNSWDSITLTDPLAVAYGGTGANNSATARSNLGIAVSTLWTGACTTGSLSFSYSYNFFVIVGQLASTGSRASITIPKSAITILSLAKTPIYARLRLSQDTRGPFMEFPFYMSLSLARTKKPFLIWKSF